jgi:putative aminopeptidase FrvX
MEKFEDLLKSLIRCPSVVGAEHAFFRELERELHFRGVKVTWYEGLLVAQGTDPNSVMFSAHIDRHGLMCTGPNEFQYAAFIAGSRSDLLGNSVSEDLMLKILDRFKDEQAYGYEPWSGSYIATGQIKNTYICDKRKNLTFELEGMSHLVAGTPVAFVDQLDVTDDCYSGQLDNVLTAACLVHLFDLGFQGTAFFTAQEEAGKSWRYLLEWFRRFGTKQNNLIVVDTSPFPVAEVKNQQLVLRYKDANAPFNKKLANRIAKICDKKNISYIFKDQYVEEQNKILSQQGQKNYSIGSTEMGRIIAASDGLVDGTTIQIPTSGYHTLRETATKSSCADFLNVLQELY